MVTGASIYNQNGHVKYAQQSSSDTWVRGWTPSMTRIYDLELIAGRTITDADFNSSSEVAVIGHDVLDNLMPGTDPMGKEIRVDGRVFRVIGVGKKEGKTLKMQIVGSMSEIPNDPRVSKFLDSFVIN